MATKNVSLKLLIDSERDKVLFAEAGKDAVDFLFNILSLPVGTVIRLLTKQGMVGCLPNIYQSIENIDETYVLPNQDKDTLLKPTLLPDHVNDVPLLLLPNTNNPSSHTPRKFYGCPSGYNCLRVAVNPDRRCPSHQCRMNQELQLVDPPENSVSSSSSSEGRGFVKGVVTYMIMDDLVVTPMSTISSITLLNKFSIKDVGSLQEKVVDLGMDQAVELLKASLQSKTVLTDVFLAKEKKVKV